jgi:hypothetical protein
MQELLEKLNQKFNSALLGEWQLMKEDGSTPTYYGTYRVILKRGEVFLASFPDDKGAMKFAESLKALQEKTYFTITVKNKEYESVLKQLIECSELHYDKDLNVCFALKYDFKKDRWDGGETSTIIDIERIDPEITMWLLTEEERKAADKETEELNKESENDPKAEYRNFDSDPYGDQLRESERAIEGRFIQVDLPLPKNIQAWFDKFEKGNA